MDEQTFHPERPPDESWWERELTRNEKLMDKYLSVFHQNPEWFASHPEDLHEQVHSGETPFSPLDPLEDEEGEDAEEVEFYLLEEGEELEDLVPEQPGEGLLEPVEEEEVDPNDEQSQQYPSLAGQAQDFALRVFDLKNLPVNTDVLHLSAGKVGANLAGGHGLGYDEETICGNIVKCRWALADCRFCSEMLELAHRRMADPALVELLSQSRQLELLIQERIERLRSRVWW